LPEACPHAVSVGSYLLEMLSPEETAAFRSHSSQCPACQREIIALMPGALFLRELRADILGADRRRCADRPVLSTVAAREPWWIADCGRSW
jgi:anti-sigma factor RsiW